MSLTPPLVARLVTAEFVAALLVCPALLMIPAPYGRYRRPGFRPRLPARLAWVLMELPAVVVPVRAFLAAGGMARGPVPWLLLGRPVERRAVVPCLL